MPVHSSNNTELSIDNQLKIIEIDTVVRDHENWFRVNHNIAILGHRKLLDLTTMKSIPLGSTNRANHERIPQ